jgi:hypothetical protein
LLVAGGVSGASESIQNPAAHRAAATLADGVIISPAVSPLLARDISSREIRQAQSPMAYAPSPAPAWVFRTPPFELRERPTERFNPARIPLPAKRTTEDHLLTGFIAVMLIAYQLRRKHRFLRPHQFST